MKTTIRYVIGMTALLLSFSSHAVYAPPWTDQGGFYSGNDLQALCDGVYSSSQGVSILYINPQSSRCTYQYNGSTVNGLAFSLTTYPSCPSEYPLQQPDGRCNPPPECPDGQIKEGGECQSQCVEGQQITLTMQFSDVQQKITDPFLGCKLEMSAGPLACNSLMSTCNITYTDTGVYDDEFTWPDGVEPEPVPPVESAPQATSTETVEGPTTETVTESDGTVTTTETTEITQLNDKGQIVEIIGDSIVLKNKDGEIIDILQQTTYNSYTDGTSKITETTTTTATPNSVTEVKKNLTDGTSSVTTKTYKSGKSGTVVTTKTETFDADGKSTGSTQVTDGKITDNGDGEGEEGEETDYQLPTGKGDFNAATTEMQQKIAQAKQDISDKMNQIQTEASALIDFNQSGSGSLPCDEQQIDGFDIKLCATELEDEVSGIGNAIYFGFTVLALFVLLR